MEEVVASIKITACIRAFYNKMRVAQLANKPLLLQIYVWYINPVYFQSLSISVQLSYDQCCYLFFNKEGLGKLKNVITLSQIEPTIFRPAT
jgi:hypothetical protein